MVATQKDIYLWLAYGDFGKTVFLTREEAERALGRSKNGTQCGTDKKALECCGGIINDCRQCPIDEKKKDDCECGTFLAQNALSLIKELTEENEAWQKRLISQEEKADKAYYDLACEVENLRAENERLRAELVQRPPKLIITKLPKKESKIV